MRLEPRLLAGLLALLLAVSFSLYKAFSALTLEQRPSGDLPSPAFVLPAQAQITEERYLFTPRLPTDLEVSLLTQSERLARAAAAFSLGGPALIKAGMPAASASTTLDALRRVELQVGRANPRLESPRRLDSVREGAALITIDFIYIDETGATPPQPARLSLSWRGDPTWTKASLESLRLQLTS